MSGIPSKSESLYSMFYLAIAKNRCECSRPLCVNRIVQVASRKVFYEFSICVRCKTDLGF